MSSQKSFLVLMVLFVLTFSQFSLINCELSREDATLALSEAEEAVASAYQVVLEADLAGADISNLSLRLNDACELLVQAHSLFRFENYDEAVRIADLCVAISGDLANKAEVLRASAMERSEQNFRLTLILSAFSVVLIAFCSVYSWRFFKGFYCRRILTMKPEVVSNES